ncbi:hypothetical protein NQZ68_040675 [Dissostichus eleginoides]|nr:hypothetical protein NQZ68_040675 [Dissostichus eleginoides]
MFDSSSSRTDYSAGIASVYGALYIDKIHTPEMHLCDREREISFLTGTQFIPRGEDTPHLRPLEEPGPDRQSAGQPTLCRLPCRLPVGPRLFQGLTLSHTMVETHV